MVHRFFAVSALALCLVTFAFAITPADNGNWIRTGALLAARHDAAAVGLPDGRILVTGGRASGGSVLSSTEIIQADGTAVAGPAMSAPRAGHTATLLPTGGVLIVGGDSGAGATVTAEVFNPNTNVFTPLSATLNDARVNHVAALDANGNVTIIGGATANGPTLSVESFNVPSQQFTNIGQMMYSRSQAAMAAFKDGRVLIAGGVDANGVTLATTEIFDPNTGASVEGPTMNVARAGASATLQIDGNIIVIGGTALDTQGNAAEIASGELISVDGSSSFIPNLLNVARAGQTAFLLPENNGVLVVGGHAAGADLKTAELYKSWLGTATLSTLAATHANGAGAAKPGVMIVAGGTNQAGVELFGFPTIKTDQADYAPGTAVWMTGTGWLPQETVNLYMQAIPSTANVAPTITTIADAAGNISDGDWAPDITDIGARFYLTAVGATSGWQAQTTFTDGAISVTVVANGSVTASPALSPVTCTSANSPCTVSGGNNFSATFTASAPAIWTLSRGTCAAGTTTCTMNLNGSNSGTVTVSFGMVIAGVSPASATYGDGATAITMTGNNFANGVSVITFNGTDLPTTCSGATACTATIPAANLTNPGARAGTLGVSIHNGTNYSGILNFTLNKRAITVSAVTNSKTYDGTTAASAIPAISAGTLAGTDSNGFSENYDNPNVGTNHVMTAAGAVNDGNGGANYTVTLQPFTGGTITPRALSLTANSDTKVFGQTKSYGAGSTAFTASGLQNTETIGSVTITASGGTATSDPVGNYDLTPSAATGGSFTASNYTITYGKGVLSVTKAPQAITVNTHAPSSATYNGQFTVSATSGSGLAVTYSAGGGCTNIGATFTITSGNTPCAVKYDQAGDTNYNAAPQVTETVMVGKVTPSISWAAPAAITYGTALSATQLNASVDGGLAGTLVYTPASGTTLNAGPHTLNVTFTPSDTTNYETANASVSLTVNKVAPTIAWTAPAAITYGTALSAAQLNATVNGGVAGNLVYTPASGEVLNAGSQTLNVLFTPTDTTNYDTASASVSLIVNKGAPIMNWTTAPPSSAVYLSQFTVAASSNSGGEITYTAAGGCDIVGATVTMRSGTNACQVSASVAADTNYEISTVGPIVVSARKSTSLEYSWTIAPPASAAFNSSFNIAASSNSTGVITYGSSGGCTVSGSTVTMTSGTNTCYVGIMQAADENYTNTAWGSVPVNATKIAPVVSWATAPPASAAYNTSFTVAASSNSSSAITYSTTGSCSNVGAQITMTSGTNTCSVSANVAADSNYNSGSVGPTAVAAALANQATLTVTGVPATPQGFGATFTVGSTGGSGTGMVTYSATGACSISGTTITAGNTMGTCTVKATKAADNNYDSITSAPATVSVVVPGTDLIEGPVSMPLSANAGGTIAVTDSAMNQGLAAASGTSWTYFYLSRDGATKGTYIGSRSIPALASGVSSGPVITNVTVPTNTLGTYYVMACANATSSIAESNTTNNCTASSTTIDITGADLIVTAITIPSVGAAGGSIQVNDSTKNQGGGSAPTSSTYFYLSADGSTKGAQLCTRNVPALSANATSGPVNSNVTVPLNSAGNYYVIACANGNNAVVESSSTNNCLRSTTMVNVAGADLIETSVTAPSSAAAGVSITVTDVLSNQGGGTAGSSSTFFYLSRDTMTKGTYLGSRSATSLSAGASASGTVTLTIPTNSIGTYYVIACANGNSSINETNAGNDCLASNSFDVAAADLTESNVGVSGTFVAGTSITIADTTINQGGGTASASMTYFYLSSDGVTKGTYLGSRSVGTLVSNATSTIASTRLTLPASISGAYSVLACANATSSVMESSTTNNCGASAQFTVTK